MIRYEVLYLHEQSPYPLGERAEVRLELLVVFVGVEADVLHDGRLRCGTKHQRMAQGVVLLDIWRPQKSVRNLGVCLALACVHTVCVSAKQMNSACGVRCGGGLIGLHN